MALSKRLFSIFSMVEKGSIAADIGCDHGLLSIALIEEGICSHVYACDLRKGPLSRASEAICEKGLEDAITTILCDGIEKVPNDVDTLIIAGMGFETIQGILERHLEKLSHYRRIIIQSNKHVDDVRRWISNHHYQIEKEDIVEEDHFYEIVAFSCEIGKTLNEDEILFGLHLENHPLFHAYWTHREEKLIHVLSQLPKDEPSFPSFLLLQQKIHQKLQKKNSNYCLR